jgi:hypothetical protein
MKPWCIGSLLLGALGLAVVAGLLGGPGTPNAGRATAQTAANVGVTIVPAVKLKVRLGKTDGSSGDLLDPGNKGWETVPATRVLLNRTPRVYQTDKPGPTRPATLEVRGVRTGKPMIFRLTWKDSTRNVPRAPPAREGDTPGLHKRPTEQTNAFADAAALMVPESYQGGAFPSLVMGDSRAPVRLYYWNAARGAEELTASGRASVAATGRTFRHQARYDDGQWAVTLEVPELPTPSPIAFAVWDGDVADRNGQKMFSIWYVLE